MIYGMSGSLPKCPRNGHCYVWVLPEDQLGDLRADEDAAVRLGLDELSAGRAVPLDEVVREIGGSASPVSG